MVDEPLTCEACGRELYGRRTSPEQKAWCWPPLPNYGRGSRIDWMTPCQARVACELRGIGGLPERDPKTGARLDQHLLDELS